MKITIYGEAEEVAIFTASYRDFVKAHDPKDWQGAFFEVLGWKNTLTARFYECTINSTNKGEAFLHIVSPAKYAEWVSNLLVDCGYVGISLKTSKAFVYDDPIYENDGLDDILYYYCDA